MNDSRSNNKSYNNSNHKNNDEFFYFDPYTKKRVFGYYEEPIKKIPIIAETDVLVVGGSQSGVCAAISAARQGVKVYLVERFGFLGGQSVYGLVVQWEKRAFINNLGAVLTEGLPKEILERILSKGDSDGLWSEPPGCPEMRDGEEWLNPEAIKITLFEMCEEEGVEILLHTQAVDVILEKKLLHENSEKNENANPKMTGVIFENKTGRFAIKAKVIIDATADLDLIWKAVGTKGCAMRDPKQRVGQGFYVWYGNIDTNKFIDWYLSHENVKGGYPDAGKYPNKVRKHLKEQKLIIISGTVFNQILKDAEEKGLFAPIEELFEKMNTFSVLSLGMKWVGYDRWCLHLMGIPDLNMLDAWQLTKYEIFRQKLAYYLLPILRNIPGWKNAYISRENIYMGSRETRWLKAVKMIDEKYIFDPAHEKNPPPIDAIGRSGAHDPGKNRLRAGYPIPYWIYVPAKVDGVLVCARACGAKPNIALNAHRGITPNMVAGQGIGTAAALAVLTNKDPKKIDLKTLQDILRANGVQLDHKICKFDFEIPENKIKKYPI
ncbi:MAG: FAD-dependent oxidoreductase [Promethearchaeota archaeon]